MLDLKLIIIGISILVILLIVISLIFNSKNKNKEPEASILDVKEVGVEDKEFSYGYEKEETIVLNKEDIKEEEKKGE